MGIFLATSLALLDALPLPHLRKVIHSGPNNHLNTNRSDVSPSLPRQSTFSDFPPFTALDSIRRRDRTIERLLFRDTDRTRSSVDFRRRCEWRRPIPNSIQQRFFLPPRRHDRQSCTGSKMDSTTRWGSTLTSSVVLLRFGNRWPSHSDLAVRRISSGWIGCDVR